MRGSMLGSVLSLPPSEMPEGQLVPAAGLVSQSNIKIKDFKGESPFEGGKIQPSAAVTKGPSWRELFEPGVKRALVVGMGLQILQQVNRNLLSRKTLEMLPCFMSFV